MINIPQELTYNLGELVTIVIESSMPPSIEKLIGPKLNEIQGFPMRMKNISGTLYVGKIQLPNEPIAIGTYICVIGNDEEKLTITIRATKPFNPNTKRVTSPA